MRYQFGKKNLVIPDADIAQYRTKYVVQKPNGNGGEGIPRIFEYITENVVHGYLEILKYYLYYTAFSGQLQCYGKSLDKFSRKEREDDGILEGFGGCVLKKAKNR